ncbi:phosphatase 2C [Micractinium conductrix]|uniref:Phosphatase 2C n=1 Tax=Micractinium conductrix TaxID=554055 RepID=A0A2P6V575_9CHLO|nr:phosphatase 2C [Micractinium conductrix]|eukprot:PSC69217.1 phosphatase 2C [Micractinium conductrix]
MSCRSPSAAAAAPTASGSTATPPRTLSSQPGLPDGQPLPQRHVRFDDSPVKTHRYESQEAEEVGLYGGSAAAAAAQSACASVAGSTGTCGSGGSSGAALERAAGSPLRAGPFVGGLAAEVVLRGRMGGSPSKAAALAAVNMRDLLHSVASLSRAGKEPTYRKTNQDNCFAYSQYCRPNQALLAALDGHGPHGHSVSGFVKRQMPLAVADALGESRAASAACCATCADPGASFTSVTSMCSTSGSGSAPNSARGCCAAANADPAAALPAAFAVVDEALHKSGVDVHYSGSTAVVCMLRGRRLTTAWVGDSKAVLARQEPRGLRAIPLTRDHKPNHPEERARIQASGGRVERLVDQRGIPVGPDRVWLSTSWVPGLAMSRALGDGVAHSVGVSSEPETSVVDICAQDKFLILATDGVWEFIDPQGAVDIVSGCTDAEEACRLLVDSAWSKWLQEEEGVVDDITVVCAKLNP